MMEVKIIFYVLVGIFLGPVASLAITPVFWLLRAWFYVPGICKSLQEEAERKGKVVEAHLLESHDCRDSNGMPTMDEAGTYSYEVNGKSYRYRLVSTTGIPETITLYYIKNPRKATLPLELGIFEFPWLKYYLVIALVVAIATFAVGMMMG